MTILHYFGDQLRAVYLLVPLWAARGLFLAVLLGLMIWVVQLPKSATTPVASEYHWHEDLRVWAWLALLIQLFVYALV